MCAGKFRPIFLRKALLVEFSYCSVSFPNYTSATKPEWTAPPKSTELNKSGELPALRNFLSPPSWHFEGWGRETAGLLVIITTCSLSSPSPVTSLHRKAREGEGREPATQTWQVCLASVTSADPCLQGRILPFWEPASPWHNWEMANTYSRLPVSF